MLIFCCGNRAHSSLRNCPRSCSMLFPSRRALTALQRTSQTCSIQDKSGDMADQSSLFTLLTQRKSSTIGASWGLALSSWNIGSANGICRKKRQHMRRQNFVDVSLTLYVFTFPSMDTRSVLADAVIPAHTMTPPL